jgi:hypothetical protein
MIKISLPCSSCGCDKFEGICIKNGIKTSISVCACDDGGGYFDITIIKNPDNPDLIEYEYVKYKSKEEAELLLNSCFTSNMQIHHCRQ